MKKLIFLRNNELDEALGVAFDIVGSEEFEVIVTYDYHEAEKQLLSFSNQVKWIILDQSKFFSIALRLLDEGLKISTGEIIHVDIIFISSYKGKKTEKAKDVKLSLFPI